MQDLVWVEKYRPSTLKDIKGQQQTVQTLSNSLTQLPHLLFHGPPGSGKTSTIIALAKDLYGDEYKHNVLELNASDHRGIDIIRTRIKQFSQLKSTLFSFKLIILDESDLLTKDAQQALRRIMETSVKNVRFCLICNWVTRVIEPIVSRCAKFRFERVDKNVFVERLKSVLEYEKVEYDSDCKVLERVQVQANGDLRTGIMVLQSLCSYYGSIKGVDEKQVDEVMGIVDHQIVKLLGMAYQEKSVEKVDEVLRDALLNKGYSGLQLLEQVNKWIGGKDCLWRQISKAKLGILVF